MMRLYESLVHLIGIMMILVIISYTKIASSFKRCFDSRWVILLWESYMHASYFNRVWTCLSTPLVLHLLYILAPMQYTRQNIKSNIVSLPAKTNALLMRWEKCYQSVKIVMWWNKHFLHKLIISLCINKPIISKVPRTIESLDFLHKLLLNS